MTAQHNSANIDCLMSYSKIFKTLAAGVAVSLGGCADKPAETQPSPEAQVYQLSEEEQRDANRTILIPQNRGGRIPQLEFKYQMKDSKGNVISEAKSGPRLKKVWDEETKRDIMVPIDTPSDDMPIDQIIIEQKRK